MAEADHQEEAEEAEEAEVAPLGAVEVDLEGVAVVAGVCVSVDRCLLMPLFVNIMTWHEGALPCLK